MLCCLSSTRLGSSARSLLCLSSLCAVQWRGSLVLVGMHVFRDTRFRSLKHAAGSFNNVGDAHNLDKHRRFLAGLPSRVEERQQSIHGRNQILAATQAYNLALEKRRVKAHISEMPGAIQRQIVRDYVGNLGRRIHRPAVTRLL